MHSFRLKSARILTLVSLLFLLFTFSVPLASASTGVSGSKPQGQPSVTIKNSKFTPGYASACDNKINASQSGTTMRAYITNTCVGGIAYWITNFTYSEHCKASIGPWCWAGWDSTVGVPECDSHNISYQRCPSTGTYLREAASGQLWRWRTETCIQFQPGDVAECSEETAQLQF